MPCTVLLPLRPGSNSPLLLCLTFLLCTANEQEFRDVSREHSLGGGDKDLVADDCICHPLLSCILDLVQTHCCCSTFLL
jgi:hypothetical protein